MFGAGWEARVLEGRFKALQMSDDSGMESGGFSRARIRPPMEHEALMGPQTRQTRFREHVTDLSANSMHAEFLSRTLPRTL